MKTGAFSCGTRRWHFHNAFQKHKKIAFIFSHFYQLRSSAASSSSIHYITLFYLWFFLYILYERARATRKTQRIFFSMRARARIITAHSNFPSQLIYVLINMSISIIYLTAVQKEHRHIYKRCRYKYTIIILSLSSATHSRTPFCYYNYIIVLLNCIYILF